MALTPQEPRRVTRADVRRCGKNHLERRQALMPAQRSDTQDTGWQITPRCFSTEYKVHVQLVCRGGQTLEEGEVHQRWTRYHPLCARAIADAIVEKRRN